MKYSNWTGALLIHEIQLLMNFYAAAKPLSLYSHIF